MQEATPSTGRIRGAALHHFVRWVQSNVGEDVLTRVVEAIPRERRGGMRSTEMVLGVIASRWYPADCVHALLDSLVTDADAPSAEQLAAEPVRDLMDRTLHGVYEVLFSWMASPERYAKYAPKLWGSYYGDGEMSVEVTGERSSKTTIAQWPGHHGVLCAAHSVAASVIYEAMGCKGATARRETCVEDGHEACTFVVTWTSEAG